MINSVNMPMLEAQRACRATDESVACQDAKFNSFGCRCSTSFAATTIASVCTTFDATFLLCSATVNAAATAAVHCEYLVQQMLLVVAGCYLQYARGENLRSLFGG